MSTQEASPATGSLLAALERGGARIADVVSRIAAQRRVDLVGLDREEIAAGKLNPAVQAVSLADGAVTTLVRGMKGCDGIRTTPWGTVLATEEEDDDRHSECGGRDQGEAEGVAAPVIGTAATGTPTCGWSRRTGSSRLGHGSVISSTGTATVTGPSQGPRPRQATRLRVYTARRFPRIRRRHGARHRPGA